MTDLTDQTARRIAELGTSAVRRWLRPAFDHAAIAYASRITIRSDELELMLEQAARRADAAIWRRALASVAMDELDIGLGAALEHPAVIRAQELAGVPPLDWALFALAPEPEAKALPETNPQLDEELLKSEAPPEEGPLQSQVSAESLEQFEPDPTAESVTVALEPGKAESRSGPLAMVFESPDAAAPTEERQAFEPEAAADDGSAPEPGPDILLDLSPAVQYAELAPEAIRLAAVHLDGIENLPRAGEYLELRFSEEGFDVVDAEGGDVIGRLRWDEIDALELPSARGALGRRRRRGRAQLIVRADRGEASFEIHGLSDVELREHLAPIMARVRGARSAG